MSCCFALQQYPAKHILGLRKIDAIGGIGPQSCCLVGSCFQDRFKAALSIRVYVPSSLDLRQSRCQGSFRFVLFGRQNNFQREILIFCTYININQLK